MPKVVSALTARTQFGQIIERVKNSQERFVVDRRGEPQAVIMGIEDFIRTIAPAPEVITAIRKEAQKQGRNKLTLRDINAEIRTYRHEKRNNHAAS